MYKLNLNKPLLGLDGENVGGKNATLGTILAQSIAVDSVADPIKMFNIATQLYNNEEIELDESDFIMLKDYCKELELKTLPKAQILKVFNSLVISGD